jgi:hypothetical protein
MMLLDEYLDRLEAVIETAYAGSASVSESARIMATVGTKGHGTVKHHSLRILNKHAILATSFYEVGKNTKVFRTDRNDSTALVQTQTRTYLASQHALPGAPLSMMDARITGPITAECALIVHMANGLYKVAQAGNITCYTYGKGNQKVTYALKKGGSLHLDPRDSCLNDCLHVGFSAYRITYKDMPTQPSVHPPSLDIWTAEPDNLVSPYRASDNTHQIIHDHMQHDIREAQDMLDDMNAEKEQVSTSHVFGLTSIAISAGIILVFCALIARCTVRRRKDTNNAKRQTAQTLNIRMQELSKDNPDDDEDGTETARL